MTPPILRHLETGTVCCDPAWEDAYRRFETPEQEVQKFSSRYRKFGFESLPRDAAIVEIFCGRGGGLVALDQMGFTNLQGVDLSEDLLLQYQGPAQLHLADCRRLPQADESVDAVAVHGGLHHLPILPQDLDGTIAEVARVLKAQGKFYINEPWQTPFLQAVHFVTHQPWARRIWRRGAAFWEMVEHERDTYEAWLSSPDAILAVLRKHFHVLYESRGLGKLNWIGCPH